MCVGVCVRRKTVFCSTAKRRDVHDDGDSDERRRFLGVCGEMSIGRKWPKEDKGLFRGEN